MQRIPVEGSGEARQKFCGNKRGDEYVDLNVGDEVVFQPPPPVDNQGGAWAYGYVPRLMKCGWFPINNVKMIGPIQYRSPVVSDHF